MTLNSNTKLKSNELSEFHTLVLAGVKSCNSSPQFIPNLLSKLSLDWMQLLFPLTFVWYTKLQFRILNSKSIFLSLKSCLPMGLCFLLRNYLKEWFIMVLWKSCRPFADSITNLSIWKKTKQSRKFSISVNT